MCYTYCNLLIKGYKMISNDNMPKLSKQIAESATDITCEKCQSTIFSPVFLIKKISPLVSPTGKEINIPVQTFACFKCHHVNDDFIPKVN